MDALRFFAGRGEASHPFEMGVRFRDSFSSVEERCGSWSWVLGGRDAVDARSEGDTGSQCIQRSQSFSGDLEAVCGRSALALTMLANALMDNAIGEFQKGDQGKSATVYYCCCSRVHMEVRGFKASVGMRAELMLIL